MKEKPGVSAPEIQGPYVVPTGGEPIGTGGLVGSHRSDCAIFNAPAYEPGPCDCGAAPLISYPEKAET